MAEAGVATLIDQEEPAPNTNWTLVLRATASALDRCRPFVIDSAALRIWMFCIHARKLGMANDARMPMITMPINNSTSENPNCLDFGWALNTHLLCS